MKCHHLPPKFAKSGNKTGDNKIYKEDYYDGFGNQIASKDVTVGNKQEKIEMENEDDSFVDEDSEDNNCSNQNNADSPDKSHEISADNDEEEDDVQKESSDPEDEDEEEIEDSDEQEQLKPGFNQHQVPNMAYNSYPNMNPNTPMGPQGQPNPNYNGIDPAYAQFLQQQKNTPKHIIDDVEGKSEDEGINDYKNGGYHPVYVGEV